MQVRADPNASVSMFGNGFDNVAGRTARSAWSDRVKSLNADITKTTDDITAHQTAETSLAALAAKLTEMKAVADQANDDTLSAEELQTLQDQYDDLHAEFTDLLADATHNGSELLSGRSPLVMLDVGALGSVDLTSDVQGGVLAVSAAMTEMSVATEAVTRNLSGLQDDLTGFQQTVADFDDYGTTLDSIDAAMAVLESVSLSIMETLTETLLDIQGDVDSTRALALLTAETAGT